ncbi:MAG: protein-export chaperone SecB, partial [Hydrotalea flava]|nr:protein-export chaperone SecB [Hydrotalea flava]NIQ50832.1 protein-export chaperone SecB [Hydrotalea flava]
KVFTKDISFETPNSPNIFAEKWNPSVDMQIANEASIVNEELPDLYEVVLRITVTVKVGEKTAYLV